MHRSIRSLVAVAVLVAGGLAQEHGQPKGEASLEPIRIDLKFGGGSLNDLVEAIRAGAPRANIVAAVDCQKVRVPEVVLANATVLDALRAAGEVVDDEWMVIVKMEASGGQPVHSVQVGRRRPGDKQGIDERALVGTAVFSLRKLTEPWPGDPTAKPVAQSPETVLSAIEAGMVGLEPPARLSYHRESGLLFVRGNPERIQLVQQVLRSLEEGQEFMRKANQIASLARDAKPKDEKKEAK